LFTDTKLTGWVDKLCRCGCKANFKQIFRLLRNMQ